MKLFRIGFNHDPIIGAWDKWDKIGFKGDGGPKSLKNLTSYMDVPYS